MFGDSNINISNLWFKSSDIESINYMVNGGGWTEYLKLWSGG